ncbi:MAG: hypothetical protein LBD53_03320 [Tannerella sp.]|jgi:hypothetical protein|nr:hypothetical protein [Tannerella sp.]
MKRIYFYAAAALLVISMWSCSTKKNSTKSNEATATSAQQRDKSANSNLKNVNSDVAALNRYWKPTVNM